MALTNKEKIDLLYEAVCNRFRDLTTLPGWLSYISNISTSILQTDIAAKLDAMALSLDEKSVADAAYSDDIEALADEVEAV